MKVSNRPKVVNICSNDNIPLLLKQHNFNSTDIIISSYKITDHIGKGNFGDVYCGKYISNQQGCPAKIAIKVIDFKLLKRKCDGRLQEYEKNLELLEREQSNLRQCKSHFVVKIYDSFTNEHCKVFFLEYCNENLRVSLANRLKQCFQQKKAVYILKQICLGVYSMYTKSIVHRDLKPENIAFVENIGTWKIIDFGFSKKIEDKDRAVRATILGSAEFKAPQIRKDQPYGTKADIYSIGMIFLKMVVGNVSYNNRVNLDLNKCTNSKNEPLNPNIIDLLEKMLKVNQKQRINWDDLLNHQVFKQIEISESKVESFINDEFRRIQDIENFKIEISEWDQTSQNRSYIPSTIFEQDQQLQKVVQYKEPILTNLYGQKESKNQILNQSPFQKKNQKKKSSEIVKIEGPSKQKVVNLSHLIPKYSYELSSQKKQSTTDNSPSIKHQKVSNKLTKSVILTKEDLLQINPPKAENQSKIASVLFRQAKIAQYVLNNIIEPLQNRKDNFISASSASDLKAIIFLCQRVHIDFWFSYIYCSENRLRERQFNLKPLLRRASKRYVFYRQLYEQLQRTVPKWVENLPKDIFNSLFRSQQVELQHTILNGEEGRHFVREQHISITVKYLKKLIPRVPQKVLISWMSAYQEIMEIECKEEKIDDYVFVVMQKY